MQGDHVKQPIGKLRTRLWHTAREGVPREHRVRQMIGLNRLSEHFSVRR